MRKVSDIQRDLDTNREESITLGRVRRRLEDELKEARLAEAAANPHPWLGKKVQKAVPASSWRKGAGTKTIRGTLEVKQPGKYYRGNSADVGELIVVTDSGLTAYNFEPRRGEDQSPWELAS
jgi:hypothetical protein